MLALGVGLLPVLACGETTARRAGDVEASSRPPDVVLVVVDTLRADAVGFLGSPHGTPHLDRLARESVVFTQAIAPSTWTVPSIASLLTSLHPSEHGLLGGGSEWDDRLPQVLGDEHWTLPEAFRAGGYRTVGVVNQIFLKPRYGFAQGFDRYAILPAASDGFRVSQRLERELDSLGESAAPLFVYLHLFDPHWPYHYRTAEDRSSPPPALAAADDAIEPPRRGDEVETWFEGHDESERPRALDALRGRYALEVRWVDRAIGALVEVLERRGLWDDAIIVVTSDHGEGFWEHQRLLHGHSPYEEQIRVPLLVRTPAALQFAAGRRTEPVSLVDLMPTLLDLAELPLPEHSRGRSLVAAMRGEEDGDRALLIETGWERALRTRDAKLIVRDAGGRASGDRAVALEYFDLAQDPGERRDLGTPCVDRCRESVRRLQEIERTLAPRETAGAGEVAPEDVEELRALGYVTD